jgi:hypothetical protein
MAWKGVLMCDFTHLALIPAILQLLVNCGNGHLCRVQNSVAIQLPLQLRPRPSLPCPKTPLPCVVVFHCAPFCYCLLIQIDAALCSAVIATNAAADVSHSFVAQGCLIALSAHVLEGSNKLMRP